MSHRSAGGAKALPIPDRSGKRRPFEDFYVPDELWPEAITESFGDLRCITLRHLTPLEERTAISRARGDSLALAFELARLAIAEVSDAIAPPDLEDGAHHQRPTAEDGGEPTVHQISDRDGSRDALWSQLHTKIRNLIMEGYGEIAAPSSAASASFTKSRRPRA